MHQKSNSHVYTVYHTTSLLYPIAATTNKPALQLPLLIIGIPKN